MSDVLYWRGEFIAFWLAFVSCTMTLFYLIYVFIKWIVEDDR